MDFDLNDEFEEDDLDKEVQLEDDADLLDYQRQKSTPKIIVQEFEGEDERSEAFKEMQEKQKKEAAASNGKARQSAGEIRLQKGASAAPTLFLFI